MDRISRHAYRCRHEMDRTRNGGQSGCENHPEIEQTFTMKILPAFFYLLALLLSGCVTDKRPPETVTGFVEVSCPSDKALVYLYRVRPWVGQSENIMMCVNYKPTVSLSGHEYCPLVLNSGFTQFGHTYQDIIPPYGIPAGTKNVVDLRVHLEAGKIYYVAYRFWLNPLHHPSPAMVLVNREEGTNEMSTCSIKKPFNNPHEN